MVPADTVGTIMKNRTALIRNMPELDAKMQLLLKLPQLSKAYGAYEAVPDYVYEEIIRLITSKYKHLSIADIEEAYRLSASGEIDDPEIKMYAGTFNAKNIGALLRKYTELRRGIIAKMEKEKTNIMQQHQEIERSQTAKLAYEQNFPALLRQYAHSCQTYNEVPAYLYQSAIRLGYYNDKAPQAIAIKQDAWERSDMLAQTAIAKESFALMASMRHFEARQLSQPDNIKSKRVTIAQKLILFEHILPNFKNGANHQNRT